MEYAIRKPTVITEPTLGKFYTDVDDDLFLFTGGGDPWLHLRRDGAYDRNDDFPAQPLTELARDEIVDAVSRRINF